VKLVIPESFRAQIIEEARAAFPNECCGLLEGERTGESVRVVAVHPTANLAGDPARGFEIDPAPHLRLRCRLRGTPRAVVGCYHSHPNGLAGPSATDRARNKDSEAGFVWLIAAVPGGEVTLAAFEGPEFRAVELKS
jgi:proteasome lid subunit RPN8/RPN11